MFFHLFIISMQRLIMAVERDHEFSIISAHHLHTLRAPLPKSTNASGAMLSELRLAQEAYNFSQLLGKTLLKCPQVTDGPITCKNVPLTL